MSVTVHYFEHPFRACAAQVFESASLAAWMFEYFGDVPSMNLDFYRGAVCVENRVPRTMAAMCCEQAANYTVLRSPGEPLTIVQVVLAVISIASALMATKPSQPANVNRTSASPNNALGDRTNGPRVLQRVEDIVGKVRAVPTMMAQTYFKYINHRKVECGYYCVTRGYAAIEDVRDGDTLLGSLTGSSAVFYGPFTSPNSGDAPQLQIGDPIIDRVQEVRRTNEVDGLTLKARNQIKLEEGATFTFERTSDGDRITQLLKRPNFNAIVNPGDEITVSMADIVISTSASVTADEGLSGFTGLFGIDPSGGGGEGGTGGGGEGGAGAGGAGGEGGGEGGSSGN